MTISDVVGIGEAMVLLEPADADLATARHYRVSVAGAELNACAAIAALGGRARLVTRLGDDPFADRVRAHAAELSVDIDAAIDPRRPTGVFFKNPVASDTRQVYYFRRGSAASALGPSDAGRALALGARVILVSGLTAALSERSAAMLRSLPGRAPRLVVDANLRPALGHLERSVGAIRAVLPHTELLVIGTDEAEPIFGTSAPAAIAAAALESGCREVVIKDGARGCHWVDHRGRTHHLASVATTVVDTVGGGDAFTGGYLWGRLNGFGAERSAMLGSRLAARVIAVAGDTAGLPGRAEAAELLAAS